MDAETKQIHSHMQVVLKINNLENIITTSPSEPAGGAMLHNDLRTRFHSTLRLATNSRQLCGEK